MGITSIKIKYSFAILLASIALSIFTSCNNDDPEIYEQEQKVAEQTVLMYLPHSGNLYNSFQTNIKDFEAAIKDNGGLHGNKLIIFVSQNGNTSYLIKVKYNKVKAECEHDTLKTYSFSNLDYTTASGITSILNDVKTVAPAYKYAMTIGCHGMGWIPKSNATTIYKAFLRKNEKNAIPTTRYFGGLEYKYQTDISELNKGIINSGIKMKYIMFDDCYMANIESAYQLKDATEHLIGSTCEIMAYGMPYNVIGKYLFTNDYENICKGFYNFYSSYNYPYGTISVTDCSQVEEMAKIMKEINSEFPEKLKYIGNIQKLDGFEPFTVFFDFGDYVDKLCTDESLKTAFKKQLILLVPFKKYTDQYYSALAGSKGTYRINTYSGLTISDPTNDLEVKYYVPKTSWYKATH